MRDVVVFDLDGTLADLTHRLWLIKDVKPNWDSFFDACDKDRIIEHVAKIFRSLARSANNPIYPRPVIASGRSDIVRDKTCRWLIDGNLMVFGRPPLLYMRKHGDHRPDYKVKHEMLLDMRDNELNPIMAFDDREQVVKMWRDNGIPCAQVADGNF